MSEHVEVKKLPAPILAALESVGYRRADIEVRVCTSVVLSNAGSGNGVQAFTTLVNLDTGECLTERGSWGGQNMFNPGNAVDNDDRSHELPPNGVAITGSRGGNRPVFATLHIPASMTSRIITAGPAEPLPDVLLKALAIFMGYKASYRREYLDRAGVTSADLDKLVADGLLSRNRAGATSITTAGKNAVGSYRYSGY